MRRWWRNATAARRALVLVVLIVAGWFAISSYWDRNWDGPDDPPATLQEAAERGEGYVRQFVGALGPTASLRPHSASKGRCAAMWGGFQEAEQASTGYWVVGVDPAQFPAKFDEFESWLGAHGWHVWTDERPQDMFLNAISPDDYLMSIQANKKGGLSLGASSPCVDPP